MRGVQRGDSLGSLFFSLAIHNLFFFSGVRVEKMVSWHCDYLRQPKLSADWSPMIMEESESLGLRANSSKSEIIVLGGSPEEKKNSRLRFEQYAPGIRTVSAEEAT